LPPRFPGLTGQDSRRPFEKVIAMSLESLKALLPDYAKDLKLNLSSLASETCAHPAAAGRTFIVSALASRQPQVIAAITEEFASKLEPAALNCGQGRGGDHGHEQHLLSASSIWRAATTRRCRRACA
jgi:hypothetical protein